MFSQKRYNDKTKIPKSECFRESSSDGMTNTRKTPGSICVEGDDFFHYSNFIRETSSISSHGYPIKNRSYDIVMGSRSAIIANILGLPQQGFGISFKHLYEYEFERTYESSMQKNPFDVQLAAMIWLFNIKESFELYERYGSESFERIPNRSQSRHCFFYDKLVSDKKNGTEKIVEYSTPFNLVVSLYKDIHVSQKTERSSASEKISYLTHTYDLDTIDSFDLLGWLIRAKNLFKQSCSLDELEKAVRNEIALMKENEDNYLFDSNLHPVHRCSNISIHWLSDVYLSLVLKSIQKSKQIIRKTMRNEDWWDYLEWIHGSCCFDMFTRNLSNDVACALSSFLQQT